MEKNFKKGDEIYYSFWSPKYGRIEVQSYKFIEEYYDGDGEHTFLLWSNEEKIYFNHTQDLNEFYASEEESLNNFNKDFLDGIQEKGVDDDDDIICLNYIFYKSPNLKINKRVFDIITNYIEDKMNYLKEREDLIQQELIDIECDLEKFQKTKNLINKIIK